MGLFNSNAISYKRYSLTKDGTIAAKDGLISYLNKYRENKDLDIPLKASTIIHNKMAVIVSTASIISFILGILLSAPIKRILHL